MGAVLGAALRAAGHAVVGASGVSDDSRERIELLLPGVPRLEVAEVVRRAELVLLAVPDDALPDLVAGLAATGAWQAGQLLVHTSGRYGTAVLAPAAAAGAIGLAVHPAMTFTGTSLDLARLPGSAMAVTAPTVVLPVAQALVIEMGAEPVVVPEQARPVYHAALAHASNHVVTVLAQARQLLADAGVEESAGLLLPLVSAAVDNAVRMGDQPSPVRCPAATPAPSAPTWPSSRPGTPGATPTRRCCRPTGPLRPPRWPGCATGTGCLPPRCVPSPTPSPGSTVPTVPGTRRGRTLAGPGVAPAAHPGPTVSAGGPGDLVRRAGG